MSPAYNQYREDVGEYGAYGLSSLAEKTRTSNHLQMLYTKAAHSPQLFKDPECCCGLGLEPSTTNTAITPS